MIRFDYDKAKDQLYNLSPARCCDEYDNGRILCQYSIFNNIIPFLAAKYSYDNVERIVSKLENIINNSDFKVIVDVLHNLINTCGTYISNGNKYLYPCLTILSTVYNYTRTFSFSMLKGIFANTVIESKYTEEAINNKNYSYVLFNCAENGIESYLNKVDDIYYLLEILSSIPAQEILNKDISTDFVRVFQKTLYEINDNGTLMDEIRFSLVDSTIIKLFTYVKYEGLFYHPDASLLMVDQDICRVQCPPYDWVIENYDKIYNKNVIYNYFEDEGYDVTQLELLEEITG